MSTFDPDTFLDGASADGEMATRFEPVPEGTYQGQIDSVEAQQVDTERGASTILRVLWEVLDENVRVLLEREKVVARQDIWLDIDESGGLATGKNKNVRLGRLRGILDQNEGRWNPRQLVGGRAMIHIRHRSDKNDPEIKHAEVDRVAALT